MCDNGMYIGLISALSYHVQVLYLHEYIFRAFYSGQYFCVSTNSHKCAEWNNYKAEGCVNAVAVRRGFTKTLCFF